MLRAKINNAWKTIYEYLGKNPEAPLSEHLFLRNHWTMYFKYTRRKGDDYIKFLLDEKFTARNVTHPKKEGDRISVEEIDKYVTSLQQSIRPWFYMHNPYFPLPEYTDEQNKLLLDRLHRLSFRAFKPLLLAAYVSQQCVEKINLLLSAAERYNFTLFTLSQRRSNTGDTEFFSMSRDLMTKKITIDSIVSSITEWVDKYYDPNRFLAYISEKYELGNHGFFKWDGIRYFLYEHEQWLRSRGKQSSNKLSWEKLSANKKDSVTIEHIFPQTPKDPYWLSRFGAFSKEETQFVAHSLGNLVPLSRAKNSSLQNDSFDLKKNNGNGVGFYNGSASENELAQKEEWLPESILERGLELLKFMEERWDIVVGDNDFKTNLLHLAFLNDKEEVTI